MFKNVCIYASSSEYLDKSYFIDASRLGELLGINHLNIIYGGSRLGLMYACVSSAKKLGSNIIGVMPEKLVDIGFSNPEDCESLYITKGMRERKAKMDELSDAIIALPGGFGTLEELSEMIVQKQLGYNAKPIILLNTNGFYDNLIKFFDSIILEKFAIPKTKELYYIAEKPEDAIKYLENYNSELFCNFSKF